jgi:hypothetical protein
MRARVLVVLVAFCGSTIDADLNVTVAGVRSAA